MFIAVTLLDSGKPAIINMSLITAVSCDDDGYAVFYPAGPNPPIETLDKFDDIESCIDRISAIE